MPARRSGRQRAHRIAIRVVIVESRPIVAVGIRRILERRPDIDIAAELHSTEAALKALRRLSPDVTLADLPVPGSIREWVPRLRAAHPDGGLVVIAREVAPAPDIIAVETDNTIYVDDSRTPEQLVAAIRRAARREWPVPSADLDPGAAQAMAELRAGMLVDAASTFHLTPRELDILDLVARGMRNREIGEVLGVTEQTVKNHLTAVMHKTGVRNRRGAVDYARRQGWLTERGSGVEEAGSESEGAPAGAAVQGPDAARGRTRS
jgi:DNA-binding NarL/FixJ family response regulator